MNPVTFYKDCHVALFGLGRSGMATARALIEGGAKLSAFDDDPKRIDAASSEGIPVADLRKCDFNRFETLVLAPGVPLTYPEPHWSVVLANSANVPIIGDMELFARQRKLQAPDSCLVAITGTNGKSTTTALIAHILEHHGRDVCLGGNIGVPILELPPVMDHRCHVVECSSYQIDLAPSLNPTIAVLLNLSPNHLDRHVTMERYAGIKERLVTEADRAIIGIDDEYCRAIAKRLEHMGEKLWRISANKPSASDDFCVGHHDGCLLVRERGDLRQVANLNMILSLRGNHNGQNAAAAWATCSMLGLSASEICSSFSSFSGLSHRMEMIAKKGRITFINDSKATNVHAAAMALSSFERIYWIAGGLEKESDLGSLRPLFSRLSKVYLIGEAAEKFAGILQGIPFVIAKTLERATTLAARDAAVDDAKEKDAKKERVILLSPACASFDQFENFEQRGDAFRKLVLSRTDSFMNITQRIEEVSL